MNELQANFQKLSHLREIKGRELDALKLADQLEEFVKENNDPSSLVRLNWERALIFQHLYTQKSNPADLKSFESVVIHAQDLIDRHKLRSMLPESHLMLSKLARYQQDYLAEHDHLEWALDALRKKKDYRSIEVKSHLAANLVHLNQPQEAFKLAQETYQELDNSTLKEGSYYTWAVWKTGIFPRLINALYATKTRVNKELYRKYLEESEDLISKPYQDYDFALRKDQLVKAKDLLSKL